MYHIPEFIARWGRQDLYSSKIADDDSVAADEYTYECKYCVLIYSNSKRYLLEVRVIS